MKRYEQTWVIRFRFRENVGEAKIAELATSFHKVTCGLLMRHGSSRAFAIVSTSWRRTRLALGTLRGYSNAHIEKDSIRISTNDSIDGLIPMVSVIDESENQLRTTSEHLVYF